MTIEINSKQFEDRLEQPYEFQLGNRTRNFTLTSVEHQGSRIIGININKGIHLIKKEVVKHFDSPKLRVKIPIGYIARIDGMNNSDFTVYVDKGQTLNIHPVIIPLGIIRKKVVASISYK